MNSDLQELSFILTEVEAYRPCIQWISQLGIKYDRIADFGCHAGYESLALKIMLKAHEVVGLDKDGGAIQQAQDYFRNGPELIRQILTLRPLRDLSDEVRLQLENFADQYITASFAKGDMTEQTTLPSNYFDLAYCECVLYLIACDESKQASNKVSFAIQEMARVLKPEGHIVAIEPQICSNGRLVNLKPQFEQAGLLSVQVAEDIALPKNKVVYFYRRGF